MQINSKDPHILFTHHTIVDRNWYSDQKECAGQFTQRKGPSTPRSEYKDGIKISTTPCIYVHTNVYTYIGVGMRESHGPGKREKEARIRLRSGNKKN